MGRQEYEALFKITSRTIEMAVIWRKGLFDFGQDIKHPYLVVAANDFIAKLSEYRLYLKGKLKGKETIDLPEELRALLDEIDRTKDPDFEKIMTKTFLKLTKKKLAQGQQEAKNEN